MRFILCGFVFLLCLSGSTTLAAEQADGNESDESRPGYEALRQAYQTQLDQCDLINAQDVLAIASTPIANIDEDAEKWLSLLEETKKARLECYGNAEQTLQKALAAGMAKLQEEPDNTPLAARLELDKQAADLLEIRQKLTRQLLASMAADVKNTLEKFNKSRRKKDKPSYVLESDKTADLIRQDMAIVLELERRQLNLEARLIHQREDNEQAAVKLNLKQALHYLTRALMAYEDVNRIKPPRLLASLRSEYLYAAGQMHEILAIAPDLDPLPEFIRPPLRQLANRMQLLELDVEGALRDFRSGVMEQSVEDWLSELYQDLSNLSIEVNNILRRLEMGEPVVMQGDDTLEIPDDIANYIDEDEQNPRQQNEQEPPAAE